MIALLFLGIAILAGGILFFLYIEALKRDMRETLNNVSNQINDRLRDNTSVLNTRLEDTHKVIGTVREKMGRLEEASLRIFEIGKDISGLQELLRAPKIRGGLGEYFLENLLSQIFPKKEYYQTQYMFKSGQKVDAVLKIGGHLVPIDSKFPLENFKAMLAAQTDEQKKALRRQFTTDVKKHISDIASKYILPDENTYDFALMYIPAENVYYEAIIKDEKFAEGEGIFHYALGKKVVPVSPNSFYAYLQVIMLGLRGMAVEKETENILARLTGLKGELDKFTEEFAKLGRHLGNSKGSFDDAEKRFLKIQEKVLQLNGMEAIKKRELPND